MTRFVDFALASGVSKATALCDFKRHKEDSVTDFYKRLREQMIDVHRRGLDPARSFETLLRSVEDPRAHSIWPKIIDGHAAFLKANPDARWFKPAQATYQAGPGMAIDGVAHHVKLYFRSEDLGPKRVDFTIALMVEALPIPTNHKAVILDLRKPQLHYLSAKSAAPAQWRKLSALVAIEAAGYAAGWGKL